MRTAVIGGGFSGLLAAYLLEKKGADVTVYEKDEMVGGHCRTMSTKDVLWDLGTVVAFSNQLKPLLIELQLDYKKKYISRNFLDEHFNSEEMIPSTQIQSFIEEMAHLKKIYADYESSLSPATYGPVHRDLLLPMNDFLEKHQLTTIRQLIAPHLSAYGFGSIYETQAYYAFKAFSEETLQTFVKGDPVLFIDGGTSRLIDSLSQRISDIRYGQQVITIKDCTDGVRVTTALSTDVFDRVFITTKLPDTVLTENPHRQWMTSVRTIPYVSCAFEITDLHAVTTYYKANHSTYGRVQFFQTTRRHGKSILVAYTYGQLEPDLIDTIRDDLERSDIHIRHLITAKQWQIFPHLDRNTLQCDSYEPIINNRGPIHFTGSLICPPSLSRLYTAVKATVDSSFQK